MYPYIKPLLTLLVVALALSSNASDTFQILLKRTNDAVGLISGTISVNGTHLGSAYENSALKIAAGDYAGSIRYRSTNNLAPGPLGTLGKEGDFLLEVSNAKRTPGQARTDILFHGGNKPENAKGCILLGAGDKTPGTAILSTAAEHPLRQLRDLFYGTNIPLSTSDKKITMTIVDQTIPPVTTKTSHLRPPPPANFRIVK